MSQTLDGSVRQLATTFAQKAAELRATLGQCFDPFVGEFLAPGQVDVSEKAAAAREILQGFVRYLGAGIQVQPLKFRAVFAQRLAGLVRDLLALAQVQLLDVWARIGQLAYGHVLDAFAPSEGELPQEAPASFRYILYDRSLRSKTFG